jgi:2-polyprenyl-6-methoxyphenol hydroxylase-like FAD-dependent oxidoreductase
VTRPVAIVGGGPVGSALALMLAQRNIPVVLIDAGASEHKICGEGILPAGWQVLQDVGLAESLLERSPLEGLSYGMEIRGVWRSMSAPLKGAAFGVQRSHLFRTFHTALESSAVELWEGTRVRDFTIGQESIDVKIQRPGSGLQTLSCRLLVGADGLHSSIRRKAGLVSPEPSFYKRWGTRCYFRSSERRRCVEVTLGNGVESYLTPLGGDLYGLAFLWSPQRLGRPLTGTGPLFRRLLPYLPSGLMTRLPQPQGEFWGGDRAIGPLQQKVASPLHESGRVALVGDAAGYFDALTGEGLCLGLRQAKCLAECIEKGTLRDYPAQHRAIKWRHQIVVGGLLGLIHRPKLRDWVFSALLDSPKQFQAVIRFAVEEASWTSLLSPDLPRFLLRLLRGLGP